MREKPNLIEKICTKCKIPKTIDEFYCDNQKKGGVSCSCKVCQKLGSSLYYKTHKKEKIKATTNWHKENLQKVSIARKKRRKIHPEKRYPISANNWRVANSDKVSVYYHRHYKKKVSTFQGRLNCNISSSIHQSLRKNRVGGHWEDLVGYTIVQLKEHIEKLFVDGMSWEKYMDGMIHIDHKIPESVFNFEKHSDIDFYKCWCLDNLQPLWASDNLIKGAKLSQPFQPSLAI